MKDYEVPAETIAYDNEELFQLRKRQFFFFNANGAVSYTHLIVDTCPALGALTINALAAADGVVITVNPQLLAMKGLQDFLKTIKKIKKRRCV